MLTAIISFNTVSWDANIKLFFLCALISKKVLAAKLFMYVFKGSLLHPAETPPHHVVLPHFTSLSSLALFPSKLKGL